jgi:cytochrome P450
MHRDPDIWGDDAETFRPERWEGFESGGHYIPFSAGPRVCPGQQLTLTETAYVLVKLLRAYRDIVNRDPEMVFVEESRLTVESRNGVLVGLVPAEEE